jgi:putative Mg2+ transporter-C (MgtC) family protein
MMTDFNIINLDIISFLEAIIRVSLAIFFGLCLGFDREAKGKTIDFRAYMIVAMTTCVVAILGQELYQDYQGIDTVVTLDIGKIIAGTLTGLGFLGAGAIIKVENKQIIGSATGASIWASGIMGLTIGFGFYSLAIVAFIAILATLVIGGFFQNEEVKDKKD